MISRVISTGDALTGDEISAKFGDKVALDYNTMSEEERKDLDARLAAAADANEIHKSGVARVEKTEGV